MRRIKKSNGRNSVSRGLKEPVVPDIRLSRTKTGEKGSAKFYFDQPTILGDQQTEEITGMYLIDEEGEIVTREVKGKFINGKPMAIEATVTFNSPAEWIVLCVSWSVTVAKTV